MTLKEEYKDLFVSMFVDSEKIELYGDDVWDIYEWAKEKIGDEGAKMYDLGKEIGYNKAIDDAIERFMNHPLTDFTDLDIKRMLENLKENI